MPIVEKIKYSLVICLLIACVPEKKNDSETLIISKEQQAAWIRNFNPLFSSSTRWPTRGAIYEPLMIYNRINSELTPWLATKYRWSKDNKRLTFDLRDDVYWSDQQPFYARDVAFTFNLMKTFPVLDTNNVWGFLEAVTANSTHSVTFDFKTTFIPGFHKIIHQSIVPEHVWQTVKDPVSFKNENPIGTGPYTEVIRFQNQVFELGRNPHYWQKDEFKIQKLRFPAFPSNQQANLALISGDIDWAGNFVPAIERTFVSRNPKHNKFWYPNSGAMIFLYLNTKQEPYSDHLVRKALSRAIDRRRLIEVALYNYTQVPNQTGLPNIFKHWSQDLESDDWTQFNLARAKEELSELGFPLDNKGQRHLKDGKPWQIEISVVSGWSDWVRAANIIANDLQQLGIHAKVKALDFSAWFHELQSGNFSSSISWSTESATPYEFYRWLMSNELVKPLGDLSPGNWHRFGSIEADKLLDSFKEARSKEQQFAIVKQLIQLFADQAPALPLFSSPSWGVYNNRKFTGFPNRDNPYAVLSPNADPDFLLVLRKLRPRGAAL